ncbi:hypothetical protein Cgig2_016403 [Carnegiea gigantea]|uniref:Uncharacterized protein n=1 Tax=Carnegiea gigantea TaxID=171969 RepID=A0A9Q1JFZ0_9CARY|nr:hypothetical protein Cgig2_030823 [Carnegiea gigantea]KAJ8420484.1 hypothetical protein Cgig2_021291 [Carnegiea gigantea]KAJ8420606.1 hypothetical protein Cgig2_016403 [Carnegiea gigantea]
MAVAYKTARSSPTCCLLGDGDSRGPHDRLAIAMSLGPPCLAMTRVSPGSNKNIHHGYPPGWGSRGGGRGGREGCTMHGGRTGGRGRSPGRQTVHATVTETEAEANSSSTAAVPMPPLNRPMGRPSSSIIKRIVQFGPKGVQPGSMTVIKECKGGKDVEDEDAHKSTIIEGKMKKKGRGKRHHEREDEEHGKHKRKIVWLACIIWAVNPTHEKYLNKKIDMYDEMTIVVRKDVA